MATPMVAFVDHDDPVERDDRADQKRGQGEYLRAEESEAVVDQSRDDAASHPYADQHADQHQDHARLHGRHDAVERGRFERLVGDSERAAGNQSDHDRQHDDWRVDVRAVQQRGGGDRDGDENDDSDGEREARFTPFLAFCCFSHFRHTLLSWNFLSCPVFKSDIYLFFMNYCLFSEIPVVRREV